MRKRRRRISLRLSEETEFPLSVPFERDPQINALRGRRHELLDVIGRYLRRREHTL